MSKPTPNAYETESNILGGRFVTFKFTAGTSGAAPTALTRGRGYALATPVTKSTNDYIVNLASTWYAMEVVGVHVLQASFSAAGAVYGFVSAAAVNSTTVPTIQLSFLKGSDGTAVALADGDIVTLTVQLTQIKP